jgi:hypothetical protein
VSVVTGAGIGQVRGWMQELEEDNKLIEHLTRRLSSNPRKRISATEPTLRQFGWYAIVLPRSQITSSRPALTSALARAYWRLPCCGKDTAG